MTKTKAFSKEKEVKDNLQLDAEIVDLQKFAEVTQVAEHEP